jgi:enoyl-[acyl-carrier-protein] reductase (NADH)
MRENAENRHPLKMILDAEDIANMATFLTSEKARAISGQVVGVDAGLSTLRV